MRTVKVKPKKNRNNLLFQTSLKTDRNGTHSAFVFISSISFISFSCPTLPILIGLSSDSNSFSSCLPNKHKALILVSADEENKMVMQIFTSVDFSSHGIFFFFRCCVDGTNSTSQCVL